MRISIKNNSPLVSRALISAIQSVSKSTSNEIYSIKVNNDIKIVTVDKKAPKSLFTLYTFDILTQQSIFVSSTRELKEFELKFGKLS